MSAILLVEDDINLREIYAARLEAEGYQVVVASDGEEALAKSVKEKPALVLLDVMMPKISGFDVLDIIRSTPETRKMKVVMLTALSQPSDKARGEKLGVDRYLVKSQITLEDVVDTVTNIIGGPNQSKLSESKPSKAGETTNEDEQIEAAVEALKNQPLPAIEKDKKPLLKNKLEPEPTEDSAA